MVCSRLFVYWAIAVCLAAFLCESNGTPVTPAEKRATQKAVYGLQTLTEKALINATRLRNHAESLLARAKTNKKNAEDAILHVSNVGSENAKAVEIANNIKETSTKIIKMYENASKAANESFEKMKKLVEEADALDKEANNYTLKNLKLSSEYKTINDSIEEVTKKVEAFQQKLPQEKKSLKPASELEINMSKLVQTINVENYLVPVLISVTEIDTVLKKAEIDIGKTEEKRNEFNNTLKIMTEMQTKVTESSPVNVQKMIQETQMAFETATKAVDEAKKIQEEMIKIKRKADASLAKFTATTIPIQVVGEVNKTKKYLEEITKKAPEIKNALQSAKSTTEAAESVKQSFLQAFPSATTQLSGEVTKNSEQTLDSATDTLTNGLKGKPTMKTSKKTVNGISGNSLQEASAKLTDDKTELPNVNNINISDVKLQKGANTGTNIALVNGKPSVSSDGSMILYLPLLAALIASAVLH